MVVISCFDGLAGAYEALKRIGREPEVYYSFEIDDKAVKVAKANHPKIVALGSIERAQDLALPRPDLLIGGSPCQGFSRLGEGGAFTHFGSKLFYDFVALKEQINPRYFLLENVVMRKDWNQVITDALGVEPILINSNLVSAQNRERLYWTNIPGVKIPRDRKIFYPNIAEYNVPRLFKNMIDINGYRLQQFVNFRDITVPITFVQRRNEAGKAHRNMGYRQGKGDTTSWKKEHKEFVPRWDLKLNCITTSLNKEHVILDEDYDLRRLTVLECERAQTLPDNYTDVGISDSKRIELIGNGFTVDVIAHILKHMTL